MDARVPLDIDRNALRHHYNMYYIENMAAKMPSEDLIAPPLASQTGTSGANTPLSSRSDFPITLRPDNPSGGNPTKRSRSTRDGPDRGSSVSQVFSQSVVDSFDMNVRGCKRRRIEDYEVTLPDVGRSDWAREGISDSYISHEFLADVNWELRKLTSITK